jgi:DNA modification methylase
MKHQIEYISTEELIPYARNSRTHSDEQVAQICGSIKEFGFTNPVLIDAEGVIIAGHGRTMAAQRLKMKEVPCLRLSHLTEAQKKAYVIADNKLALNAGWDDEMLALELAELKNLDFDLSLTGFDDDELNALLVEAVEEGLVDEDEVPEAPEEPVSVLGDVWMMGSHKVVCGDATSIDIWERLEIPYGFVVFTSPPYNLGQSIKLSGNKSMNKGESAYKEYNDDASDDDYIDLIQSSLNCGLSFCDVAVYNLQPLAKSKRPLMKLMSDYSSNMIDIITWDKGHAAPQMAKGVLSSRYEWLFLFSNKQNASRSIPYASWQGKFSNVYQAPPQRKNEFAAIHGATFPVHLPEFVIGDLMNKCRGIVDCFCGTGTSVIAAEKLGRSGYGIEIDPKYVDVIVTRWQDYTGKQAVHAETGKTFDEIRNG